MSPAQFTVLARQVRGPGSGRSLRQVHRSRHGLDSEAAARQSCSTVTQTVTVRLPASVTVTVIPWQVARPGKSNTTESRAGQAGGPGFHRDRGTRATPGSVGALGILLGPARHRRPAGGFTADGDALSRRRRHGSRRLRARGY